jgi:hypothetical protein
MSWQAQVIADDSGEWRGNALRFGTQGEAEVWVAHLYRRWSLVRATRVVWSNDPPTHAIVGGMLTRLEGVMRLEQS